MKKKEILKRVIREFHLRDSFSVIKRDITLPIDSRKIITLIGSRRTGKTSIMYDTINNLSKKIKKEQIIFINFEDERLDLELEDLDYILQAYSELYPDIELESCYFFFDEIQNTIGWERFVRRVYDTISKNIFITGSNSKLLSVEIASSLRGRTLTFEVFPLSFREFLRFKNIDIDFYSLKSLSLIKQSLSEYLTQGGFPELIFIDKAYHTSILQEYFDVMIYKDLVERYKIGNIVALKFFLKRVIASSTKEFSINKIYNDLKSSGIKIGKNSLYDFLEYLQNIYLAILLPKYSTKIVSKELGDKKIFAIDMGLVNAIDFSFSKNRGKALENAVFLELKRAKKEFFYYKEDKFECDFLIKNADSFEALQVSYDISDEATFKRELKALIATSKKFNLDSAIVVTFDSEDEFIEDNIRVKIVPFFKWSLEQ